MNWHERTYWNTHSYGNAIRVKKHTLQAAFVTFCMLTPATNWLIPFVRKIISNDFILRY